MDDRIPPLIVGIEAERAMVCSGDPGLVLGRHLRDERGERHPKGRKLVPHAEDAGHVLVVADEAGGLLPGLEPAGNRLQLLERGHPGMNAANRSWPGVLELDEQSLPVQMVVDPGGQIDGNEGRDPRPPGLEEHERAHRVRERGGVPCQVANLDPGRPHLLV